LISILKVKRLSPSERGAGTPDAGDAGSRYGAGADPSYPIHIYGAVIAGAQVRSVPLVEGVDFFNELERAIRESYPKPKMMILGFPSNPTAQCVELDFFEKVVALAKRYDVLVVHDLAYADIVYDGWKALRLCRFRARVMWR
jgi:aspartate/methionine/tyrosine aminotransferase